MNIGEIFSTFRKERGITLKEATGNQFSTSMLSRFENGQTDISAEKLLYALDNIYLDAEEFLYLMRDFHIPDFQRFQMDVFHYRDRKDLDGLKRLREKEGENALKDGKKQYHRLNQAILSVILTSDFDLPLPKNDLELVQDYLFKTSIWGSYELYLFVRTVDFFPSELLVTYCRQLLHRMDFLDTYPNNRLTIHSIFLNAMLTSIERKRYSDAKYFEKQILHHFDNDRDLYLRLVFRLSQETLAYCEGRGEAKKEIDDLITFLVKIGNTEMAQYYKREIANIIEKCK